jgi:hemoglobin
VSFRRRFPSRLSEEATGEDGAGGGTIEADMAENEILNIHDLVGGYPTFEKLVDHFYDAVEDDPVLRPLYPQSLEAPRLHLALFLSQFFGGPPEYSERRGHPRLRARHLPFVIGRRERDAWVKHMLAAIEATGIEEPARSHMQQYFENAATFLINQ